MVGETNEITFTNLSISDSGTYRCNVGNEATLKFADKYIAVNRKSFGYHLSHPLWEKCAYSEFFWSVFSRIWTEYGEILRISPYSVCVWENTYQKNFEYGHFSRSDR